MKKTSRVKRVASTASELALLVAIFILGGLILPIYAAPYFADIFSITTPYEAARQTMSVQIQNRNVSHGETVTIGVSDPASTVRVKTFSYECDFPEITLAYVQAGDIKEIPCDTELSLPDSTQHRLMVLTTKQEITYMPISLTLENEDQSGGLSVIIATAAEAADEKSSLKDSSTATLQSFPGQ